jgi:hypothetical protein
MLSTAWTIWSFVFTFAVTFVGLVWFLARVFNPVRSKVAGFLLAVAVLGASAWVSYTLNTMVRACEGRECAYD